MNEQHELSKDMLIELRRLSSVFHQANLEVPARDRNSAILTGMIMVLIEQACEKMEISAEELTAKFVMSVALYHITKDFEK
jgi:hypothetical protein